MFSRVGHNAKLTIREELANGTEYSTVKEKKLSGPYTIFNLDKDKSKIFVGSVPPQNYKMQKEIVINYFVGEIEDLVIGNTPVGLWNFNYAYNTRGAMERNKLVNLAPSTGYRFNGNGYVILDGSSYTLRARSSIQLMFKTFANNGLLFLAGKR
ncbi:hypothetical protein NQ317_009589 [Molorchus minor]|uniref:Uncharacterized protein n=1 Tax=Molorchus minor TaxID=1323400 RepID=A0ABQ9J7G4_9CUCU|nr:hypothetical protein NQ317_009589 [Molorchus minor]